MRTPALLRLALGIGLTAVLGLTIGVAFGAVENPSASDSTPVAIAGVYESPANLYGDVIVETWKDSAVHVHSEGFWESVGFFSEGQFSGVLREIGKNSRPRPGGSSGTLRFSLLPDGRIRARVRLGGPDAMEAVETWTRIKPAAPDYPHQDVDPFVNPEAVEKIGPIYPEEARRAHIQGTVMVAALVGKDGLVKDCKVIKSIPGLDEAAVAAVKQWRFRPVLLDDKPVAAWAAVPIKFTLH